MLSLQGVLAYLVGLVCPNSVDSCIASFTRSIKRLEQVRTLHDNTSGKLRDLANLHDMEVSRANRILDKLQQFVA